MSDAVDRLLPGLRVGERVTLVVRTPGGAADVLGFVTELSDAEVGVIDRRGRTRTFARGDLVIGRRMPVALGRNPLRAPPPVLRGLADRAGASGTMLVARISDLLAGQDFPAAVPAWGEWATFDGVRARFEDEWVTLPDASADTARRAAWWATRMGARSVLVATADTTLASSLLGEGFARVPETGR